MSYRDIIENIDQFVHGGTADLELANLIEIEIDRLFPEDDYMQSVVVMLASYRPGGGDYLYDVEQISKALLRVKAKLLARTEETNLDSHN